MTTGKKAPPLLTLVWRKKEERLNLSSRNAKKKEKEKAWFSWRKGSLLVAVTTANTARSGP